MKIIDKANWKRQHQFNFFNSFEDPLFNVCVNVDVTPLYNLTKKENLSFYMGSVFVITKAINSVPELRVRIRAEGIVEHEVVHPYFTTLKPDQTVNFCYAPFHPSLEQFKKAFMEGKKMAENEDFLMSAEQKREQWERDDVVYLSCLPWISFNFISHPRRGTLSNDCIPRLSWGKYNHLGDKVIMPLGLQIHHGLADGLHAGLFYEHLHAIINELE